MKKNFKRWLALVLAVVLVSGTCLTHTDSFLWATDGETTEATNENVQTVAEGTGETAEQQIVEQQPVEEKQEVVIPKKEEKPTPAPAEQEKKEETKVEEPANKEQPKAEEPAKETQLENKTEANQTIQGTKPAGESAGGQEVEVVPSDKKENLYNVVFHKPAVDGGTLYVWEEGKEKQEASYINGKFTKEVKEGTTLYFEIKTADNYSVEKVTDKSGQVMTPEKTTENTSTYKMVVKEKNDITILYKEVKVEEPKTEEQPKEEPKVEEPQKNETTETPTEENQVQAPVTEEEPKEEDVAKPAQTLKTSASDGATIVVTSPEGALPEGAKVTAVPVLTEEVEGAVEKAVKAEGKVLVSMKAYDITITDANGNIIQPDENVKVTIKNTGVKGDETSVYHVDNNNADKLTDVSSAKAATFSAEHFSIYVVAGSEEVDPEAETLTVKINYLYESGAIAEPSFTMVIEKTGDNYIVSKEIPVIKGYTPVIVGESAFEIKDGILTGTFTENTPQTVDIVYQANPTTYTVKHLFENLKNEYIEDKNKEETLEGKVGALTEAKEKTVEGFTAQTIEQKEIEDGGTTVVTIKYDRNDYTLTYMTLGGSYVASVTAPYESEVTLVSGEEAPTRKGYVFDGWYMDEGCEEKATSPLKLTKDTKVYAKWDGVEVNYKVVYLTENADDDNYSYAGTVTLRAKAGTKVSADARTEKPDEFKEREHFTFKEATTATVNADGSTVVNVKYSRNKYTITFEGTAQYSCGKQEHTHTVDCYQYTIWGKQLICGKEAHTHNKQCEKLTEELTITAKYRQNIKDLWNAAVGPNTKYKGCLWEVSDRTYTALQETMLGDMEVGIYQTKGTTRHLYYYVEDPNGTVEHDGKKFKQYNYVTFNGMDNLTYDEDFYVIDGYDRYDSNVNWNNKKAAFPKNSVVKFY